MIIRAFNPGDLQWVKSAHAKHYGNAFEYTNFLRNFHYAFSLIEEETDSIVLVGGIRPIAEIVAITDKDKGVRLRREALLKLLTAVSFAGKDLGYDQLHAFVQDPDFVDHLTKNNFRSIVGTGLVHDI